jgi:hypothetical protein
VGAERYRLEGGNPVKAYAITCFECGSTAFVDDDPAPGMAPCPTCEADGADDPYAVEYCKVTPCPLEAEDCESEFHHPRYDAHLVGVEETDNAPPAEVPGPLPAALQRPCGDCPWRRAAAIGWLGPYDVYEWAALIQSDEPIACHERIREDESWEGARQCAGAAIMRANMGKLPRDREVAVAKRDTEHVFANVHEFVKYHQIRMHDGRTV